MFAALLALSAFFVGEERTLPLLLLSGVDAVSAVSIDKQSIDRERARRRASPPANVGESAFAALLLLSAFFVLEGRDLPLLLFSDVDAVSSVSSDKVRDKRRAPTPAAADGGVLAFVALLSTAFVDDRALPPLLFSDVKDSIDKTRFMPSATLAKVPLPFLLTLRGTPFLSAGCCVRLNSSCATSTTTGIIAGTTPPECDDSNVPPCWLPMTRVYLLSV